MARSPTPVESFGPELLAALIAGSKSKFEIALPYSTAVKFRQRIYQLRFAMRMANHPQSSMVSRTRIQITWPEGTETKSNIKKVHWPKDPETPCKLIISPYDSEFADALGKAGIKTVELQGDPLLDGSVTNPALKDYGVDQ